MVKLNSPCLAQRQPPHGRPLVLEKRVAGNMQTPSANSGMGDNGRERELGEVKNMGPNTSETCMEPCLRFYCNN